MSEIKDILSNNKTIAMIGVSKDPKKPSTIVMKYMQKYGYRVIPVNPSVKGEKILGEEVFGKLNEIKTRIDIVDVFKAKVLWLQLGITSDEAKKIVEANNIEYVENKCTKMEYQKIFLKVTQAFPVLINR
jgi:predicted CoA-binding protein